MLVFKDVESLRKVYPNVDYFDIQTKGWGELMINYERVNELLKYSDEELVDILIGDVKITHTFTKLREINEAKVTLYAHYDSSKLGFYDIATPSMRVLCINQNYTKIEDVILYVATVSTSRWCYDLAQSSLDTIARAKEILASKYKVYLESIRPNLLEMMAKRRKQLIRQSKGSSKNAQVKKELLELYGKVLLDNGFQVSKIANFEYDRWNYYVTERRIPDKWHKYISVGANIKFATVECRITQKSYKLGIKLETTGQIGCDIEALNKAYKELVCLHEEIRNKLDNIVWK